MQNQQQQQNQSLIQCEQHYQKIKSILNSLDTSSSAQNLQQIMDFNEKIHLSLVKVRSRLSKSVVSKGSNILKRRLAEIQAKEVLKDKRFTRGFGLDKLTELKSSFQIQLFPDHFILGQCPTQFSYDGPMYRFLIDIIEHHEIPSDIFDILDSANCIFYDGGLVVDVIVHEGNQSHISKLIIFSSTHSNYSDLLNYKRRLNLSDEDLLEVEQKLLHFTETICLDPNPLVGKLQNIIEYNKKKFNVYSLTNINPKRFQQKSFQSSADNQSNSHETEMESIIHYDSQNVPQSKTSFYKSSDYILNFRKNKELSDKQLLPSMDRNNSKTLRKKSNGTLQKLIRTIRFKRNTQTQSTFKVGFNQPIIYTTLNFFVNSDATFDVELAFGSEPDTCSNGRLINFTLPDINALEIYFRNFTQIYTQWETNQLVNDFRSQNDIGQIISALQQQQSKVTGQNPAFRQLSKSQVLQNYQVPVSGSFNPQSVSPVAVNFQKGLPTQDPVFTSIQSTISPNSIQLKGYDNKMVVQANSRSNDAIPTSQSTDAFHNSRQLSLSGSQSGLFSTSLNANDMDTDITAQLSQTKTAVSPSNSVSSSTNSLYQLTPTVFSSSSGNTLESSKNFQSQISAPSNGTVGINKSLNVGSSQQGPISRELAQQLLKMPPDQVPEEYKALVAQLRIKIAKHQQLKSQKSNGANSPALSIASTDSQRINTNPVQLNQQLGEFKQQYSNQQALLKQQQMLKQQQLRQQNQLLLQQQTQILQNHMLQQNPIVAQQLQALQAANTKLNNLQLLQLQQQLAQQQQRQMKAQNGNQNLPAGYKQGQMLQQSLSNPQLPLNLGNSSQSQLPYQMANNPQMLMSLLQQNGLPANINAAQLQNLTMNNQAARGQLRQQQLLQQQQQQSLSQLNPDFKKSNDLNLNGGK